MSEQVFHVGKEGVGFFALKGDVIFLATGLVELVKAGHKRTIPSIDSLMYGGFGGAEAELKYVVYGEIVARGDFEVVYEREPNGIHDREIPSGAFLGSGGSACGLGGGLVPSLGDSTKVGP